MPFATAEKRKQWYLIYIQKPESKEKARATQRRYYENHKEEIATKREQYADERNRRRAAKSRNGICSCCGHRSVEGGRKSCGVCYERNKSYKQRKFGYTYTGKCAGKRFEIRPTKRDAEGCLQFKCTHCGEYKYQMHFPPDKNCAHGISTWCQKCHNESYKKWKAKQVAKGINLYEKYKRHPNPRFCRTSKQCNERIWSLIKKPINAGSSSESYKLQSLT